MLGDIGQVLVDLTVECYDAVDVVIGAAEDGGAGWRADRVCDVAVVEEGAFLGQTVEVGGVVDVVAVC